MRYDFDKIVSRTGTNSLKYDFAIEHGMPKDILPLWVADMDFPVAQEITEAIHKVTNHGIYGYSDTKDSYFEAVADWMQRRHHWKVEKSWLVKTPGIVFAIAAAVRAFTKEGEGVLIQTPVYHAFRWVIQSNQRVVIENPLLEQNGKYTIDFEDFEKKIIENQIKLFILCSPHNPVGRVWKREELLKLAEICLKHHVIVASDEIHQDFIYPNAEHLVFVNLDERLKEITITCTAPSKTFNLAGLQISNLFIPNENLKKSLQKEIEKTGYGELNPVGVAACESAYRYGEDWLEQLKIYLEGNIDFVISYLEQNIPQIHITKPEGTYLIWLDCRELGMNPEELNNFIVQKAGLWLNGGAIFGQTGSGFQRMNIACPREILKLALDKLAAAVASIQ